METITIKVDKVVTENKELQLPYYTKWLNDDGIIKVVAKVYSKDECIHVSKCYKPEIKIAHAELAFHGNNVEATQDEFEALLSSVNTDLLLIGYTNKETKAA
jgi:hypothetical protein